MFELLLLHLARYFTGTFTDVVPYTFIPWDPDTSDLQISTEESEESGKEVVVLLSDDNGDAGSAGVVVIFFTSPIQYQLGCTNSATPFHTTPPTETEKIWRISYTQTSQQIVIFCNDVKVLDLLLSDDVCDYSGWRDIWERDVKEMFFLGSVSVKYCTAIRGSYKEPPRHL